jgi:hypothetical protein
MLCKYLYKLLRIASYTKLEEQEEKNNTEFENYQLDCTMYNSKYVKTYEQWVKK